MRRSQSLSSIRSYFKKKDESLVISNEGEPSYEDAKNLTNIPNRRDDLRDSRFSKSSQKKISGTTKAILK